MRLFFEYVPILICITLHIGVRLLKVNCTMFALTRMDIGGTPTNAGSDDLQHAADHRANTWILHG
jgi:hypothetical protein